MKAAAERRLREAEIRRAASAYVATAGPLDDPVAELMRVAAEVVGFKDYLRARLELLDAGEWRYKGSVAEQVRSEVLLYERALDRTGRILTDLGKLGVMSKMADSAADLSTVIIDVIKAVLADAGLSPAQAAVAAASVPARLMLVAGGMNEGDAG